MKVSKIFRASLGLSCNPSLKTFVAPFLPARLTAPGSPRVAVTLPSELKLDTLEVIDCSPAVPYVFVRLSGSSAYCYGRAS